MQLRAILVVAGTGHIKQNLYLWSAVDVKLIKFAPPLRGPKMNKGSETIFLLMHDTLLDKKIINVLFQQGFLHVIIVSL